MKTYFSIKSIMAVAFSLIITKAYAGNSYILDIFSPEYSIFYVVGLLILFAFIVFKILKRNEEKNNRINSVRRFNRHRSFKQF